jgi:curved DNA-binding protein CbpA
VLLGVDRKSSHEVIKTAYYDLAKKYHPDAPDGDPQKFKEIA